MAVYIIRAGDTEMVKIGWAEHPTDRLAEFQVAHYEQLRMIRVIDGLRPIEAWMHRYFADCWVRGEWHRLQPEMLTVNPPALSSRPAMHQRMHGSIAEIIALWPSDKAFSEDVGATVAAVRLWRHRDSVPASRWAFIERGALARGIPDVTALSLAQIRRQAAESRRAAA